MTQDHLGKCVGQILDEKVPRIADEAEMEDKKNWYTSREGHAVAKEVQSNMVEMPPIAGPGDLGNPLQPLFPSTVRKLL